MKFVFYLQIVILMSFIVYKWLGTRMEAFISYILVIVIYAS